MRAFFKGFFYAGRGIVVAIGQERNMRVHLCVACYVLVFSLFYGFSALEYALLFFVIFMVFGMEMANTAIERLVDERYPAYNEKAGLVKDIAAGAVLVVCIGAVGCGFFLFWDTSVFFVIFRSFARTPLLLLPLFASFVASGLFVFCFGKSASKKDRK